MERRPTISLQTPDAADYDTGSEPESEASDDTASVTSLYQLNKSREPDWARILPAHHFNETSGPRHGIYDAQSIYAGARVLSATRDALGPRFRLLQISPGTEPDSVVHGKLVSRPLFDPPLFKAVSYSWGSGPVLEETLLIINGVRFPISLHLWTALRRLRDTRKTVSVWVDAICIDQQNLLDKAAQVQIMAQIYNAAEEVVIWLGDSEHHGDELDPEFFWSLCQGDSPWWKRLWIVQECAYAQKCPIVLIGHRSLTLEEFVRLWTSATETASIVHEALSDNLRFLRMPLNAWMEQVHNCHRAPLLQRLRETSGRQCTVPHDKIYALLSLTEETEEIIPDYRKSFTKLSAEVKRLLRKQADWDEERDGGLFVSEPLDAISARIEKASLSGHEAELRALLYANAVPASILLRHLRPAAHKGHVALVRLLLDALLDADTDVTVQKQVARYAEALYAASVANRKETARLLLRAGAAADVPLKSRGHRNTIQTVSASGNCEMMKVLLDAGVNVNAQTGDDSGSALYVASSRGHHELVKLLLEAGARVNARGGQHGNALRAALEIGSCETAQILLEAGATLGVDGSSPVAGDVLYLASEMGQVEVMKLLLASGADANAKVKHEYGNALQAASRQGHQEAVELLLRAGADVNAQEGLFGTALQAASYSGSPAIVKLLLAAGANVSARANPYSNDNALSNAICAGHQEVVTLLLKAGADIGTLNNNTMHIVTLRDDRNMVKLLLDAGIDADVRGGSHSFALQAASAHGYLDVMKLLLNAGADVNAQGGVYGNALYAASAEGHAEAVKMLLDRGAKVKQRAGGRFENALYGAAARGHAPVVKLLLARGANVHARGGQFGNALQAAEQQSNPAVIEMLRKAGNSPMNSLVSRLFRGWN